MSKKPSSNVVGPPNPSEFNHLYPQETMIVMEQPDAPWKYVGNYAPGTPPFSQIFNGDNEAYRLDRIETRQVAIYRRAQWHKKQKNK